MKIQKLGRWWIRIKNFNYFLLRFEHSRWSWIRPVFPQSTPHIANYRKNRENGDEVDNPPRKFPEDGTCVFLKGELKGQSLYGVKIVIYGEDYYDFEIGYVPGKGDEAWMEEKDANYLERIEREGRLKELEPIVWCLCEKEQATNNIGEWWAKKLLLPDILSILEREMISDYVKNCNELQQRMINETIEEAKINGRIFFMEVHNKCMDEAEASAWYNNTLIPEHIVTTDFSLNFVQLRQVCDQIADCPTIKTLNFMYINLTNKEKLGIICDLFEKRNDFTQISLRNTHINNEALGLLLKALNLNCEIRGVPLIEEINLSDNRIEDFDKLMLFLEKYIPCYIEQQYKLGATCLSSPPLTIINLENNIIQAIEGGQVSDVWLSYYEGKLNELSQTCPLNLRIFLAGNLISACVFSYPQINPEEQNDFEEIIVSEDKFTFFKIRPLLIKKSLISDEDLTRDMGNVYLACRSDAYLGHLVIYTEFLNCMGQIEVTKLELFSKKSYSEQSHTQSGEHPFVTPSNGQSCISPCNPLQLAASIDKKTINIDWQPVQGKIIRRLIYNIEREQRLGLVRYSIDGVLGHNCATWALEKLKEVDISFEVDTRIPTRALSQARSHRIKPCLKKKVETEASSDEDDDYDNGYRLVT